MRKDAKMSPVVSLGFYRSADDALDEVGHCLDPFFNFLIHFVEELRKRPHERWSQELNVFDQVFGVASAEANSEAPYNSICKANLLKNMCQWHIGQVNVLLGEVVAEVIGRYLARDEVQMRQHCNFGFTCGSRCDAQVKDGVVIRLLF